MRNWMECVRSRKTPNAPIEAGYSHSIALCMNVAAIQTGQKVTFDDKTQQVIVGRQGLCVDGRPGVARREQWCCWSPSVFRSASCKGVQVIADESHRRVDITIDGKPFTSYIWPTSLKKPVLYPLITDDGVTVTRGFPLEPRPGERVDHPHHAGLWFNYGNVNGFDFWNNSDAIKPENRSKMGIGLQEDRDLRKAAPISGELDRRVDVGHWAEPDDTGADDAVYLFGGARHARVIDQIITLKALDRAVFHDDKEGLLGMRVAHWLESPDEKGGVSWTRTADHKVAAADTTGAMRRVSDQRRSEG